MAKQWKCEVKMQFISYQVPMGVLWPHVQWCSVASVTQLDMLGGLSDLRDLYISMILFMWFSKEVFNHALQMPFQTSVICETNFAFFFTSNLSKNVTFSIFVWHVAEVSSLDDSCGVVLWAVCNTFTYLGWVVVCDSLFASYFTLMAFSHHSCAERQHKSCAQLTWRPALNQGTRWKPSKQCRAICHSFLLWGGFVSWSRKHLGKSAWSHGK